MDSHNYETTIDSLIVGQWKNFIFHKIQPHDYTKVMEHIKSYFLKEELTCKLLGYTEIFADEMTEVIFEMLGHNLSFFATDIKTNEVKMSSQLFLKVVFFKVQHNFKLCLCFRILVSFLLQNKKSFQKNSNLLPSM